MCQAISVLTIFSGIMSKLKNTIHSYHEPSYFCTLIENIILAEQKWSSLIKCRAFISGYFGLESIIQTYLQLYLDKTHCWRFLVSVHTTLVVNVKLTVRDNVIITFASLWSICQQVWLDSASFCHYSTM